MEGFRIEERHNQLFISETLEAVWKMNYKKKKLEEENLIGASFYMIGLSLIVIHWQYSLKQIIFQKLSSGKEH